MNLSPAIAIHLFAALTALAIGPLALWARRAGQPRARLHRAAGYAWVTLMLATALSALFISDPVIPSIAGFGPIHLLIPVVLGSLVWAFRQLLRGNVHGHRQTMLRLYLGACVGAGVFALVPGRTLGQLVWGQWLGLV
jgi:uncharacterized membrane protein